MRGIDEVDHRLFKGEVDHPRVQVRLRDGFEPIFVVVLKLDYLSTARRSAVALKCEVVVEESREVDRYFLSLRNLLHSEHLVLPGDRVGVAGVRDWSPVPRVAVPEVSPGDLSVVVFDPVEDDDFLAGVLLLVDDSAGRDGAGCHQDRPLLLGTVADREVLSPLLLPADCGLDHEAEHVLLGQAIVVEDALEEATCAEGTDSGLQRQNHRLAADQKSLVLLNP